MFQLAMMKMTLSSLLVFLLITTGGTEIPMISSQLPVVGLGLFDFQFQLKTRDTPSIEIRPSPTIRLALSSSNQSESGGYGYHDEDGQQMQESSVPHVAALSYYDQKVVDLFRRFLISHGRSAKMTSQHRHLIEKYIQEWDETISEPDTKLRDKKVFIPELEMEKISIPPEINEMFKLLRMSHRVSMELPTILQFSSEEEWIDEVRLPALKAEIESGKFFHEVQAEEFSFGMLKLSDMYFTHPWQLFPKDILKNIPIKDLVNVAVSEADPFTLKGPLKWLTFAKTLLEKQEATGLQHYFGLDLPISISGMNETAENIPSPRFQELPDTQISRVYLDILMNITSFKHDAAIKGNPKDNHSKHVFPEPLSETKIEEQSEKYSLQNLSEYLVSKPNYEQLCNGFDQRNLIKTKLLRCRFDSLNAPWLTLMPAKVEIIHEDPQIVFFHHVLSDNKIRIIQQLALPLQKESETFMNGKHILLNSRVRSSFVTFLPKLSMPEVTDIDRITSYLTGLETTEPHDAERLQVNVYRPGGHYAEHTDAFGKHLMNKMVNANAEKGESDGKMFMQNGDRIATFMLYLNNVEKGGRTVFTDLGVSISPEKGGAVLWYSLHNDGEVDKRMKHAGCPIISGVKWVANKWIHYNSQLFTQPCLSR